MHKFDSQLSIAALGEYSRKHCWRWNIKLSNSRYHRSKHNNEKQTALQIYYTINTTIAY